MYDLTEWIPQHPGGNMWFARSTGRDLTATVRSYHYNYDQLKPILKKYETSIHPDNMMNMKNRGADLIIPKDMDPKNHIVFFDWGNEKQMLYEL